ncbi:hypothetical protein [Polaribacter sp.]|uniref:hypothetical protein n=1 Tax=Polaribacter sp. TaxID=1920175 RepID=UPI003F6B6A23
MSEFNIRFFAYKRLQQIENAKIFEINRVIIGAGFGDNKQKTDLLNTTKKVLIGTSRPKVPQFVLDRFKKERLEYENRKKK